MNHAELPYFEEGQVWRCNLSGSRGVEIMGRGPKVWRPCLIIRKFNPSSFLAVPLTTRGESGTFKTRVRLRGVKRLAIISQLRTLDSERLEQKLGNVDEAGFEAVRKAIRDHILRLAPDDTEIV